MILRRRPGRVPLVTTALALAPFKSYHRNQRSRLMNKDMKK